jgi:uncharacterized protein
MPNLTTQLKALIGVMVLAPLTLPIDTSDARAAQPQTTAQPTPQQAIARSKGMRARQLGDHATAIGLLRPLADGGDAEAQNAIGEMLIAGKDARVVRDDAEAAAWFRKAAIQGLATGQVNLGLMLERGAGAARSEEEAARWYRRAALQSFAAGQHHLARLYETGKGLPLDLGQAVFWYAKAVNQNYAPAQTAYGRMHLEGIGVPKNPAEGFRLIRRAADQGFPEAQRVLGELQTAGTAGSRQ